MQTRINELETENTRLLSCQSDDLTISISKYTNYIINLIESIEDNHYSKYCFSQRFPHEESLYDIMKAKKFDLLALKAYQYITDLLINLVSKSNSQILTTSKNITPSDTISLNKTDERGKHDHDHDLQKSSKKSMDLETTGVSVLLEVFYPKSDESILDIITNKSTPTLGWKYKRNSITGKSENNTSIHSDKSSTHLADVSKCKATTNQLNEYFGKI